MRALNGFLAALGLAAALTSHAQTIPAEFTETFDGTFSVVSDPILGSSRREESTLVSSSLPASLASTTFSALFPSPFTGTLPVSGSFFGGNATDTYFGELSVDSYVRRGSSNIWDIQGTFSYSGGSGVYDGISGAGRFAGIDTYDSPTSGSTTRTMTVPIPEPSTYAMLFAGLALLGFVARRRRP